MDPQHNQTHQPSPFKPQSSSLNQTQDIHNQNEHINSNDEDWEDEDSHENQEQEVIENNEGKIEEQGESQKIQQGEQQGMEANNVEIEKQQIQGQQEVQIPDYDENDEQGEQQMDDDPNSSSEYEDEVALEQQDEQYLPKRTDFVSQESEINKDQPKQKQSQDQPKQKISPENKLKQLISTFFTAQNSPYASAPEKVQAILQDAQKDGIFNPALVDLSSLSFPVKNTPNNFCSFFFIGEASECIFVFYLDYSCKNCSLNKQYTICFCEACFQPQKHEGHEYTKQKANPNAFCDCGRPQSVKLQSFCKSHAQCKSKQLPDQIENKAQSIMTKQFQATVSALIDCAIYLQNNQELIEKIGDLLLNINSSSVYYNRKTFQILNKQSRFRDLSLQPYLKEINTNFYAFALYFQRFLQLTIKLAADLKTNQNIIKVLCHTFDRTQRTVLNRMIGMGKFLLSSLINVDSLKKLAESGFIHIFGLHTLHKNMDNYVIKNQAQILKQEMVNKLIQESKTLPVLMNLEDYVPKDLSLIYLFKIIELFPNAQTIQKQINSYNQKTGETGPTSVYTLNAVKKVHPSVTKASQHITQVLEFMSNRYMKISQDLRNYVIIHQVSEEKLDTVLSWLITNICHQILFEKDVKIKLIPVLSLMIGSQKQKQHIEHFWKLLLSLHSLEIIQEILAGKKVLSSSQMHHFVNIFCYVVTKVLQSDFHKVCSNIFLTIADPQVEEGKADFSYNVQFLQNWFFSFLYESKYVSREKIIQMRQNGYLHFASASDILNQLCYYNESKKLFCYTCPESFKSIINKFPIAALRGDYNSIYANTIHFGYQSNIDENSVVKKLVNLLFSADNIVPLLDAEWGRYVLSEFVNRKDHYYGYLYILALVIIDVLNEGVNTELRERLEIIRRDPEAARSFSTKQQEIQLIKRLLRTQLSEQVSPKKQQQESQKQISPEKTEIKDENDLQAKKRKAEQKKKKIAQRFKKQNLKILATSQEVIGEKAEQVQVFCILCHQKQKQNNELAYICSVKKNDTSCNALYGKQNKTNTFILSCMHVVHVNCFSQIEKSQQFQFKCPLCKKNSNCILPVNFNRKLKRLNTICRNSVVVSIIVSGNSYNVESLFILILKHLVESKGLNSLISKRDIEQKRKIWAKNDSYLFSYIKFLYESMSEHQKSKELSKMDSFIEQILTSRINKVREIQLLIATTLKLLITNNQQKFDKQIYLRVRALIIKQEFQTLKLNLESLIGSKIEVPEESTQITSKQSQKQRVYVRTFALPHCALDTLRVFFNRKCMYTQQHQGQLICLLCGLSICYKCLRKHGQECHNDVSFIFNLVTFKSQYRRRGPAIVIDIYENEFKVSISEGISQGMEYTEFANYFTNMDKFGELTEKFLEN